MTAPSAQLSVNAPAIQWYPGHIAKAEKALHEALAKVDLVIEVRDARIPLSTGHPRLQRWISGKQHLLVLNRRDMVPPAAQQLWSDWFRSQGQQVWWCDAKAGSRQRSGPARPSMPAGPGAACGHGRCGR
jgi:ribosome biogenesis GTPase A